MIIEKIKHDCWVYKNIDGIEYRGKYIDRGYSYADFIIEKQSIVINTKYYIFRKNKHVEVPVWNQVFVSTKTAIRRDEFYDVKLTESFFNTFIAEPIIVHKDRLESDAEKRERIINEIIK